MQDQGPGWIASYGGLAQLGEHLLCKQGVVGSIPSSSTNPAEIIGKQACLPLASGQSAVRSLTKRKKVVSLVPTTNTRDTVVIAS